MAFEKRYTARQAAEAVLKKTQELLEKSDLVKSEKLKKDGGSGPTVGSVIGYPGAPPTAPLGKGETENPKKENAKPSEHGSKDADQHAEGKGPVHEIHPKEQEQAPSDETRSQSAPWNNPKEQAEGNNELAGTTPTQVGQDGKNLPGGDEIKGHLKLAKFIGRMDHKRTLVKMNKSENGQLKNR